jgi:hypothetical protein
MLRNLALWLATVLAFFAFWVWQKGNVSWLFWIIAAWTAIGTIWQLVRARRSSVERDTSGTPKLAEGSGQFDPEFCGRIARIGAICCVVIVTFEFIILLTFKSTKCPEWQFPTENRSASIWIFWVFVTIWTLNVGYHAVTWRRFSRKILDQIDWAQRTYVPGTNPTWFSDPTQFKAMCAVKNNTNMIIVVVHAASVVIVALPMLVIATACI